MSVDLITLVAALVAAVAALVAARHTARANRDVAELQARVSQSQQVIAASQLSGISVDDAVARIAMIARRKRYVPGDRDIVLYCNQVIAIKLFPFGSASDEQAKDQAGYWDLLDTCDTIHGLVFEGKPVPSKLAETLFMNVRLAQHSWA
jgi:hypothetical protein